MATVKYIRHLPELLTRQRHRCYYCGVEMRSRHAHSDPSRATVDHATPRSRGGSNEKWNLVAACFECNQLKADMTSAEFVAVLLGGDRRVVAPKTVSVRLACEVPGPDDYASLIGTAVAKGSAQGMSARRAKTPKAVEGASPPARSS